MDEEPVLKTQGGEGNLGLMDEEPVLKTGRGRGGPQSDG